MKFPDRQVVFLRNDTWYQKYGSKKRTVQFRTVLFQIIVLARFTSCTNGRIRVQYRSFPVGRRIRTFHSTE